MPRLAADVSNYTGNLAPSTMQQLKEWEVDHLIIGTQDVAIAKQQIDAAKEFKFSYDLYVQFDANQDIFTQFRRANEIYNPVRFYGKVWVACEQIASKWNKTPGEYRTLFENALVVAKGHFGESIGIYTSKNEWSKLMLNTEDFWLYELWYANYDKVQKINAPIWRAQGFGGWWEPTWKQYEANYTIGSNVVDFNVAPEY